MTTNAQTALAMEQALRAICDESGDFEYRRYSGRGMYGRECPAVDVEDIGSIFTLGRLVAEADLLPVEHAGCFDGTPSMDNMGLGYIVYWPRYCFDRMASDE